MVLFEAKTINANVKNETLKKLRNMEKIVDEEEKMKVRASSERF